MSEENIGQENVNPTGADFRSPYVEGTDKRISYPFFITSHEVDFRESISQVEKRVQELTTKVRNSDKEIEKKTMREEIASLKEYRNHLIFASNGHFDDKEINPFKAMEQWTQAFIHEGKPHGVLAKKVSVGKGDDNRVTGSSNVKNFLSKKLNVGTPADIDLADSGIRVRIGNISESSIIDLMEQLAIIRSQVGFSHKGSMLTATDSKIICAITEFCLSHVVGSTLKDSSIDNLLAVFQPSDAMALAAGTLKSIYPEGYPFIHTCINTEECSFETFSKDMVDATNLPLLDFGKLVWYDLNKTDSNLCKFLSVPFGTHDVEDVLKFQDDRNKPVKIGPLNETGDHTIRVYMKRPSYLDYREYSFSWLSDIVAGVDDILKETSSIQTQSSVRSTRIDMINNKVYSLRLMKYAPWIHSIEYTENSSGEVSLFEGRDDVIAALEVLCNERSLSRTATGILNRELVKLCTSMTGIPMFKCPKCGTVNQSEDPDGKPMAILARNVIADFFFITELKRAV